MKKLSTYFKILIVTGCVSIACLSFGSFSGKIDDDSGKFSLKNLHVNHGLFFSGMRLNGFSFNKTSDLSHSFKGNQLQVSSMIRVENGNTTYVYPYRYKVKVPRFKTPTPPASNLGLR